MGRLVLVNAVLDSQLVYQMSSLLLPQGIIKQVDRRRRGFLWSGDGKATGAKCLVAWKDVQCSKREGGLGVKDLSVQNIALLLKLLHRLYTATDSSWAIWARSQVNLANLKGEIMGDHWGVLRALLPTYRSITTVQVKGGRMTSFWHDAWCGDDDLASRFPALLSHVIDQDASVREVSSRGLPSMLRPRLTAQAAAELVEVETIASPLLLTEEPDVRECFAATKDGKVQASLIYRVLRGDIGAEDEATRFVWKSAAPPRVRFFGWLASRGKLQCRSNLVVRGVVDTAECAICHEENETAPHILFQCSFANQLWSLLQITPPSNDRYAWLHLIQRPATLPSLHFNTFVLLCCWCLWKRRNWLIFDGSIMHLEDFLRSVKGEADLWRQRMRREDNWVVDIWCTRLEVAS